MPTPEIQARLRSLGNSGAAAFAAGFFKTGPGQYGEGDVFLGIRVPVLRGVAKEYRGLALDQIIELLRSAVHEERLLALLILVWRAAKPKTRPRRRSSISTWPTPGSSTTGTWLIPLHRRSWAVISRSGAASRWIGSPPPKASGSAESASLQRYISFVRDSIDDTLRIAERLLGDREDLIHKAAGWMLREVGKRDQPVLEEFLRQHVRIMPRTMLRYAIERFPAERRLAILRGDGWQ